MTEILFDRLAYLDRLKRAGISEDHARAHADAMNEALRESVATKVDIAALKADIAQLKADLTIRMGGAAVAIIGILAAIKVLG